jgi:hypothetical protein
LRLKSGRPKRKYGRTLLHGLESATGQDPQPDLGIAVLEEIKVADLTERHLGLKRHRDIEAFLVDLGRIDRSGGENGEGLSSLLLSTLEEEVSRGLGEEEHLREKETWRQISTRSSSEGKEADLLRRQERQPKRTEQR